MKILLIDDEPMVLKSISNFITYQLGHDVTTCTSADEAREIFDKDPYPMVISDIRMPGLSGIDLIKEIKARADGELTDIVLITGHANLNNAIEALRAGAYDFLQKPIDVEHLAMVIERVAEHQSLLRENKELTSRFDERLKQECKFIESKLKNLQHEYAQAIGIGRIGIFSPKMREIIALTKKLYKDPSIPVLIEGETGTGKEVIARLIHFGEGDSSGPFVTLNCSAISPTLFESELFGYEGGAFTGADKKGQIGKLELADGGTLFLDEIGDLPLSMQPKLLKAIEEKEIYRVGGIKKIKVSARIICATNSNIEKAIEEKKFREDLYYRINTSNIHIPPLRERKVEILPMANMFLEECAKRKKSSLKYLSEDAAKFLENYHWPGNVRQLKNAIERADFVQNEVELRKEHFDFLSGSTDSAPDGKSRMFSIEFPPDSLNIYELQAEIVRKALTLFDGNKTQTAKYLNISINKLRRILGEM